MVFDGWDNAVEAVRSTWLGKEAQAVSKKPNKRSHTRLNELMALMLGI